MSSELQIGMQVRHVEYGLGSITDIAPNQVTVQFPDFLEILDRSEITVEPGYAGFLPTARRMAALGIPVFPISPGKKFPACFKGFQDKATSDDSILTSWADTWPNANVGCLARPDGFVFIDEDKVEALHAYHKGRTGQDWPITRTTQSQPGHRQSIWRQTDRTRALGNRVQADFKDGILSFRQRNEYVLSEGSIHPTTKAPYALIVEAPVVAMPDEVVDTIESLLIGTKEKSSATDSSPQISTETPKQRTIEEIVASGEKICEPGRNDVLSKLAHRLWVVECCSEQDLYLKMYKFNEERVEPPLPAGELNTILKYKKQLAQTGSGLLIGGKPIVSPSVLGNDSPIAFEPAQVQSVLPDDPLELLETKPTAAYQELLRHSKLAQTSPSWLSQHAEVPHAMQAVMGEWLVEKMFRRHGLSIICAEQGSFKTILTLFLAQAMVLANKNPKGVGEFLGRTVRTKFEDDDDRPLVVYYIDLDSPKGLTKSNCLRVGLDEKLNDGSFRVYGAYHDDAIETMDDPRLIEAAKRERAFFVFDTLSKVSEGLDENSPVDMNLVMTKAARLAYASEGVLILHHDAKSGGYRGATPIVNVPDMSFSLSREDKTKTQAELREIRFKDSENYRIKFEIKFGSFDGNVVSDRFSCTTLFDSFSPVDRNIAACERKSQDIARDEKDQALIDKAKSVIEVLAESGKPAPSQNALARLLGIKNHRTKGRILVQGTDEDPRPWLVETNDKGWTVFVPAKTAVSQSQTVESRLSVIEESFDDPEFSLTEG